MKNENENDTMNELVKTAEQHGGGSFAQVPAARNTPLPQTREQLEIVEELHALERTVEEGFGALDKISELLANETVFDIVDAYKTTMVEKGVEETKIIFELVEQGTGVARRVMQSADGAGIREKYATLFSRCKALGIPREPLVGYHFVEKGDARFGNVPIILEKVGNVLGAGGR